MLQQNYPKILEQNRLVKYNSGISSLNAGIFHSYNTNVNLIQNDIYVQLSQISKNKYNLLVAKQPLLRENPFQIFSRQFADEKTARKEYKNIIETDKKRRGKIINKIFSWN